LSGSWLKTGSGREITESVQRLQFTPGRQAAKALFINVFALRSRDIDLFLDANARGACDSCLPTSDKILDIKHLAASRLSVNLGQDIFAEQSQNAVNLKKIVKCLCAKQKMSKFAGLKSGNNY